jgi:anhydro-N-acetylmuramic acid kinase
MDVHYRRGVRDHFGLDLRHHRDFIRAILIETDKLHLLFRSGLFRVHFFTGRHSFRRIHVDGLDAGERQGKIPDPFINVPSARRRSPVFFNVRPVRHQTGIGNHRYFIGMMSGTSADGIDAVVARVWANSRQLKASIVTHLHRPFPAGLRDEILKASLHGSVSQICELNFALGEYFAKAALAVIGKAKLAPKLIAAIGSHGQTIHHLPNAIHPSTLQIGEPAVIAARTGILTVADFRVADMAAGGQGAPLVPYTDWALLTDPRRPRVVQNIGGIANLTLLLPGATLDQVIAFDTGPGNMVIDGVVSALTRGAKTYDANGAIAALGKCSANVLKELLRHPFLSRVPPKTTGREEFGEPFINEALKLARRARLSNKDTVATITAFTAESIADAYRRFVFPRLKPAERPLLQIVLGGGGAKNRVLMRMLREKTQCELLTHEHFGINNSAKEALAFAILAHETLRGRPSNVPSATGALRSVVLGKLAFP